MAKKSGAYKMPYKPLVLKRRLLESGIGHAKLCRLIEARGYPKCSRSLVNVCVNRGYLPATDTEKFRETLEGALREIGVATEGIWETEEGERLPQKGSQPKYSPLL